MGFFSRLGSRISSGLHSAARVGKKALGTVHRVGNTIASTGEKILNTIDRVPILGQVVSPVSGIVRSGIGLVKDVAGAAGAGADLIDEGEKLLSNPSLSGAKNLISSGKSNLEKGSKVGKDASQLMRDVQKLSKDVSLRDMAKSGGRQVKSRLL